MVDIIVNSGLTKKQYGILRSANRSCGLSYRSACNRGIDQVRELQHMGLLKLLDNGKDVGRFKFVTTQAYKDQNQ